MTTIIDSAGPVRAPQRLGLAVRGRPAPRTTSAASVAAALRGDIMDMTLFPGTSLRDSALCERFGVSRTPVREALIRLADEELVEIFPQSGTFVARIPAAAIPEAVLVRRALEGVTVAGAAGRGETADLDDVLARQERLAARNEMRGFHEADEAFHETIAALSGHPGIWRLLKGVKAQLDRARRLTLPALNRMAQVVAEHRRIRDCVAVRDVASAQSAMSAHLSVVIPDLAWLRQRHPDYFV